jgi:hypothetical protein
MKMTKWGMKAITLGVTGVPYGAISYQADNIELLIIRHGAKTEATPEEKELFSSKEIYLEPSYE